VSVSWREGGKIAREIRETTRKNKGTPPKQGGEPFVVARISLRGLTLLTYDSRFLTSDF